MAKIHYLKTKQPVHKEPDKHYIMQVGDAGIESSGYVPHDLLVQKHIDRLESHYQEGLQKSYNIIKEQEDFNRWMWKYLKWLFIITLSLGALVWVVDIWACGEEVEPMETIKVVRGI